MNAEEIVRNLAAISPMVNDGFSGLWCPLCPEGCQPESGSVHSSACPYRQAVEWVAANPPAIGIPFDVPSSPGMAPMSGVIVEGPMPGRAANPPSEPPSRTPCPSCGGAGGAYVNDAWDECLACRADGYIEVPPSEEKA